MTKDSLSPQQRMNATLSTGVAKISTKRKVKQAHVSQKRWPTLLELPRSALQTLCNTGEGWELPYLFFEDVFQAFYSD